MQNNNIFIVGVGRSGTSLLQSMLSTHPQIQSVPETSFLRRYVIKGRLTKLVLGNKRNHAEKILKDDHKLQRSNFDFLKSFKKFCISKDNIDFKIYNDFKSTVCSDYKYIFLDKDPKSIEHIPTINKIYPNSKYIQMIRDPRDVLLSRKKAVWSKKKSLTTHLVAISSHLTLGMKTLSDHEDNLDFINIKYEDLITKSEITLKSICELIGIEFDIKMLSYSNSSMSLISDNELSWKKETLGPILNRNFNKWQNELSSYEINLVQLCLSRIMSNYSYSLCDKLTSNHVENIVVKLHFILIYILVFIYTRYIYFINKICLRSHS